MLVIKIKMSAMKHIDKEKNMPEASDQVVDVIHYETNLSLITLYSIRTQQDVTTVAVRLESQVVRWTV